MSTLPILLLASNRLVLIALLLLNSAQAPVACLPRRMKPLLLWVKLVVVITNTTAQDPTGGTGNVAAAAATTNDDETGYEDIDDPAQTLVEMSTESYLNDWSLYEVEALALRLGYNKGWSVVSLDTAYLQTENSYQNRELYKTFKAVWHPEVKHWTLPPGRDLRRAYEGGWIVNCDMV